MLTTIAAVALVLGGTPNAVGANEGLFRARKPGVSKYEVVPLPDGRLTLLARYCHAPADDSPDRYCAVWSITQTAPNSLRYGTRISKCPPGGPCWSRVDSSWTQITPFKPAYYVLPVLEGVDSWRPTANVMTLFSPLVTPGGKLEVYWSDGTACLFVSRAPFGAVPPCEALPFVPRTLEVALDARNAPVVLFTDLTARSWVRDSTGTRLLGPTKFLMDGVNDDTIAVVRRPDGRLHAFARDTNWVPHQAWQVSPGGAWSAWQALPLPNGRDRATSTPVAVNRADGRVHLLQVVHTDFDGDLLMERVSTDTVGTTWSPWRRLAPMASRPIVGTNLDGRLELSPQVGGVPHLAQIAPNGDWLQLPEIAPNPSAGDTGPDRTVGSEDWIMFREADGRLGILGFPEGHGAYTQGRMFTTRLQEMPGSWTTTSQRVFTTPGLGSTSDGGGIALQDVDGNGLPDLFLMSYDDPDGGNTFRYKIGWQVDAQGNAASWSAPVVVPGLGAAGDGAGIAFGQLNSNPAPDMVLLAYDAPDGANSFRYVIGYDVGANGQAQSWSPVIQVPGVGSTGQGAGVAFTQLDRDPRPEMILLAYDAPTGANSFRYVVGWNISSTGVAQRWSPPVQVAGVGGTGAGAGIAIGQLDDDPRPDAIVVAYDDPASAGPLDGIFTQPNESNPSGLNSFRLRIGWNLDESGVAEEWTPQPGGYLHVDGVGTRGGGADVAFKDIDGNGIPELFVMAVDAPSGGPDNFRWSVFKDFGRVCPVTGCTSPAATTADCDADPATGREARLDTHANCGRCGRSCTGGAFCAAGQCALLSCPAGYSNCDGLIDNGCETAGVCSAAFSVPFTPGAIDATPRR